MRGRLEVRRGEFLQAYRRLRKTLRLAVPGDASVSRDPFRQIQLSRARAELNEAFGLLAVAAYETGNDDVLDWALDEARLRFVDVSSLDGSAGDRSRDGFRAAQP